MAGSSASKKSAFSGVGLKESVGALLEQIQALYASDQIPWVIGYSGGKDSTAITQLVWLALAGLDSEKRFKPVHVITTDTLVENPVVSAWVRKSLECMDKAAAAESLPIYSHLLTPEIKNTFWVNLIGRGYPAPRPKFRWCTERLKINPADNFVSSVVKQNGEAILVLGTRKSESSGRAARMKKFEASQKRHLLSPSTSLANALVFAPIADWSNDDVWLFLMQFANPWGYNNKDLLTMYQGATEDGECPLVVDTTTPSCGNSRFGCWVCTMVDQDKSMAAMIQNDVEKEWMLPLLELRDEFDQRTTDGRRNDYDRRDFRRMSGHVQLNSYAKEDDATKLVHGPYTADWRERWLRRLLSIQNDIRSSESAPEEFRQLELISMPELHEIRRIWVVEKHEIEDRLPKIYEEELKTPFPVKPLDDRQPFGPDEMQLLREICGDDDLHFELVRELLDVERGFRATARRSNLFERLEKAFRKSFFEGIEDATERAVRKQHFDRMLSDLSQGELDVETAVEELDRAAAGT